MNYNSLKDYQEAIDKLKILAVNNGADHVFLTPTIRHLEQKLAQQKQDTKMQSKQEKLFA